MGPPRPRYYRFDRALLEALLTSVGTRNGRNALTMNALARTFFDPASEMSPDNWRGKIRALRDAPYLRLDLEAFEGDAERLRELADALNRAGARTQTGTPVEAAQLVVPLAELNEELDALQQRVEQLAQERDALRHELAERAPHRSEKAEEPNIAELAEPRRETDAGASATWEGGAASLAESHAITGLPGGQADGDRPAQSIQGSALRKRHWPLVALAFLVAAGALLGAFQLVFRSPSRVDLATLGPFPANMRHISSLLKRASNGGVYVAMDSAAYGGFLPDEFARYYKTLRGHTRCDKPSCGVRLLLPPSSDREALRARQVRDPGFLSRLRSDGTLQRFCEAGTGAPCMDSEHPPDSKALLQYLTTQDRNIFEDMCCPATGVPKSSLQCRVTAELPPVFMWATDAEAIVGIPGLAGPDRSWSFVTQSTPLLRLLRRRWEKLWHKSASADAECGRATSRSP